MGKIPSLSHYQTMVEHERLPELLHYELASPSSCFFVAQQMKTCLPSGSVTRHGRRDPPGTRCVSARGRSSVFLTIVASLVRTNQYRPFVVADEAFELRVDLAGR